MRLAVNLTLVSAMPEREASAFSPFSVPVKCPEMRGCTMPMLAERPKNPNVWPTPRAVVSTSASTSSTGSDGSVRMPPVERANATATNVTPTGLGE